MSCHICFSIIMLVFFNFASCSLCDLEEGSQKFVLETKQLHIPGFPGAFNPSIVRWRGSLLLSFRDISSAKKKSSGDISGADSQIGLVWLDEQFIPNSPAQLLDTSDGTPIPARAEDARLILVGNSLYVVYSDNREEVVTEGGFRMYIAEVDYDGYKFSLHHHECLANFEGESPRRREKNWVPFDYHGTLLLAYQINPHKILCPQMGTGSCSTVATTKMYHSWQWGDLRGGTSGILIDEQRYLAFFHSSTKMATVHSNGKVINHYFIGAYTYAAEPPFNITHMSPEPIIGKDFYHGKTHTPYWGPVRVVFPCGFITDASSIWMVYGRQDHEIWITKIDRKELLESLIPVHPKS